MKNRMFYKLIFINGGNNMKNLSKKIDKLFKVW